VAPDAVLVVVTLLVVVVVLVVLAVLEDADLLEPVLDDALLLLVLVLDVVADVADTEETDAPHPTRLDWIETSSYQKVLASLPYDSQPK
jgi:hypothetical protein